MMGPAFKAHKPLQLSIYVTMQTNAGPKGGMLDLRLLMDRSPCKAKIRWWLMVQKVMDRITELGEQHLKLVVIHDFLWALIEEQALTGPTNTRKRTEIPDGTFVK